MPGLSRKIYKKAYGIFKDITKAKIYRICGYFLFVGFGVIGFLVFLLQPGKIQEVLHDPGMRLLPAVLKCLFALAFNVFLWTGVFLLWRADRKERPEQPSRWFGIIKFYGVFTLFMLPIFIVMVMFMPFMGPARVEHNFLEYVLPADFTKKEVESLISKMRKDRYYQFYFHFLGDKMDNVADEVYSLLEQNRSKELLYQALKERQEKVSLLARLFGSIIIPKEYTANPEDYPELNNMMAQFLYEEFKLTVLGTFYKATYDNEFSFKWDKATKLTATKLQRVLLAK